MDFAERCVHAVQRRNEVRRGFPGAVLCAGDDVLPCQGDGNGVLLDGRRTHKAALVDPAKNFFFKRKVFEFCTSRTCHVFSLVAGVLRGLLVCFDT